MHFGFFNYIDTSRLHNVLKITTFYFLSILVVATLKFFKKLWPSFIFPKKNFILGTSCTLVLTYWWLLWGIPPTLGSNVAAIIPLITRKFLSTSSNSSRSQLLVTSCSSPRNAYTYICILSPIIYTCSCNSIGPAFQILMQTLHRYDQCIFG